MAEASALVEAMRLRALATARGFRFQRVAPGPDGPLLGVRDTPRWHDRIYLAGFSVDCSATRRHKSRLSLPGGPPGGEQVCGDALSVLGAAVGWSP